MPKLENLISQEAAKGAAIGAGIVAFAVVALPVLFRAAKPMVRCAVKSALLASEKAREAFAEAGEALEDVVAEVHAELAENHTIIETAAAAADETTAEG